MLGGKTIFSWNVPAIFNGDPKKFAQLLVDGNFEGVCLKACDGDYTFKMWSGGPWPNWGENIKQELIDALRAAGLKIYFWHFLYGYNPAGELSIADHVCKQFHPDGYIWDAESIFDSRPKADSNARLISQGLKASNPDIPQALCWWPKPKNPSNLNVEWHPVHVAEAFLETVDCIMPMMYWGGSSKASAIVYLETSLYIWKSINRKLPIIPVGRSYTGDAGTINADAITGFATRVKELSSEKNLIGISWWVLDEAFEKEDCWLALKNTEKFNKVFLSDSEKLKRLVSAHPELFPELSNG